jgi:rhodanese-related sulfurtransferase
MGKNSTVRILHEATFFGLGLAFLSNQHREIKGLQDRPVRLSRPVFLESSMGWIRQPLLWAFTVFSLVSQGAHAQIRTLPMIDQELRTSFPRVASITSTDLHKLMKSKNRPIILDVREADEFAVSHLVGAIRVNPDADLEAVLRAITLAPKNPEIIVYCSVGVRSVQLADRLREGLMAKAAARIANLREGIFGWHNAQLPLVQGAEASPYIHPYNASWGRLVHQQEFIAYAPISSRTVSGAMLDYEAMTIRLSALLGVVALIALVRSFRRQRRQRIHPSEEINDLHH